MQLLGKKMAALALSSVIAFSAAAQTKKTETKDDAGNKVSISSETIEVQDADGDKIEVTAEKIPAKKWYWGNSLDAGIFSTSFLKETGVSRKTTPLRFTMFFHIGATYNYDFSNNVSFYTGLDLKNIGFTEKSGGYTTKRRIYAVGVPVGIRLGNMRKRNYVAIGGGVDFALNYKEKMWGNGMHKQKFNEWFSDRTPLLQPYIFAAYTFHPGISLKAQYYPSSFMNQDFTENVAGTTVMPYAGIEKVNLLLFSIGFDMHFNARKS